MWRDIVCRIFPLLLIGYVYTQDYKESGEIDASVCSEEYESCGTEIRYINTTQNYNNTSNETESMETSEKAVTVRRHCCDGLTCIQGADEEPVASGVTDFCRDPSQSDERERMFEKWKKSLEMPNDYSYNKK